MKTKLCLLLILLPILIFAGCKEGADDSPQQSPLSTSSELSKMPAEAAPPGSMAIGDLLNAVNIAIGEDENGEIVFHKDDATLVTYPEDEDILHIFLKDDVEIVIIESRETGGFGGAYFRSLNWGDEDTETNMALFAGVFLMTVEPDEYKTMYETVVPVVDEYVYETKICSGEFWDVSYTRGIMYIMPLGSLESANTN